MSLLANVNQPTKGQYYFALDSTPNDPTTTAPRFEAIGDASGNGSFTAFSDDTTGAGAGVFAISSKISGASQWAIGLDGIPAGANSGNNLAIFAYGDGGAFLSAPLQINRATGDVETFDALTVGNGAAVGGSLLQVNGTLGLSRAYDVTYNPPITTANRVAYGTYPSDPISVTPANQFFSMDAVSMPGLVGIFTNPAVNIIQVSAQFGIETTSVQPSLAIGYQFNGNGVGDVPFVTGTTYVAGGLLTAPATFAVPVQASSTLFANLVRGVHFNSVTTVINVSFSAATSAGSITFLNNDENPGASPAITVSVLGMM